MNRKEYISPWQLSCVTASFILGTSLIYSGGTSYGGRDTWISEIVSTILGVIIILMLSFLLSKFPGKSILEILTALIGPFLGKLFLLYFIFFAILLAALIAFNIQNLFMAAIMTATPGWVFCLTLVLSIGYIIRKGLEPTVRSFEIVFPVVILVLTAMFIVAAFQVDLTYILPVFSVSWISFLKSVIIVTSLPNAEIFLLAGIAIYVKDPRKILPGLLAGHLIAAFFLILRQFLATGIFSLAEAEQLVFPTYMVARTIHFGNFVERIEIFLIFTWFFVVFSKVAACIFVSLDSIRCLFKLPDIKPLVYPFCIFLIPLSLKGYGNYQETPAFISQVLPLLDMTASFVVLPLLLFISILKSLSPSKKGRHKG